MKKLTKYLSVLLIVFTTFFFAACDMDENPEYILIRHVNYDLERLVGGCLTREEMAQLVYNFDKVKEKWEGKKNGDFTVPELRLETPGEHEHDENTRYKISLLDTNGESLHMGIKVEVMPEGACDIKDKDPQPSDTEDKGGYWKLTETKIRKAEDEKGSEGYASYYYTASELVHTVNVSVPETGYHDSGFANQTATCTKPPEIIKPGDKVIMSVSLTDQHGGDCGLRSIYASITYGRPDKEHSDNMYNGGIDFTPTKEGAKYSAYLDTIGNTPYPDIEVYHEFSEGSENGEEISIHFYGAASSTLWIYQWVAGK